MFSLSLVSQDWRLQIGFPLSWALLIFFFDSSIRVGSKAEGMKREDNLCLSDQDSIVGKHPALGVAH